MPDNGLAPAVDSTILPPQAVEYLQSIENAKAQEASSQAFNQYYDELLQWCNGFYERSSSWRRASWQERWLRYRRDAEAIYDPEIARRKKDWQSRAFIPLIPSHKETIKAQLFKTLIGPRPPLEMKPRGTQMPDQSDNIRDIIVREMEKSRFEIAFDCGLDDAMTYGSGFFRLDWKNITEDRIVREPVYAPIDPSNLIAVQQSMQTGPQVIGYNSVIHSMPIYRGTVFEHVSIWDIFPDPMAIRIKGFPIAVRYRLTYGDVVKGAADGYFLEDAAEKLKDIEDSPFYDDDQQLIKSEREITDEIITHTAYQKNLRCFELWAKLPKKWIYAFNQLPLPEGEDGESLISSRVIFHKQALLAVEISGAYDGEPPLYKMDYEVVPGRFYGRGISEALRDLQCVINEGVNQRLDAVNLALTKKYAAIEAALVDKRDFNDELGGILRFDLKKLQQNNISDIRAAFMELNTGTIDRAAFIDPQEMERYAQERTSANRVTIGTAGQVRDANQTLGGMELLRQAAGEKFAYVGMLMEFTTLHDIFRAYWKTVYMNLTPEDIVNAIGPERARGFVLMSPEEVESAYNYVPQGVFTAENKALMQARLQAMLQQFGEEPWLDVMAIFDQLAKYNNLDANVLKLTPEETYKKIISQATMRQAEALLPEPKPMASGGNNAKPDSAGNRRAE